MALNKGRARWECHACHKVAFGSQARALETLQWAHGTNSGKKPERAYQCPYGNGWHLTSQRDWVA